MGFSLTSLFSTRTPSPDPGEGHSQAFGAVWKMPDVLYARSPGAQHES